MSDPAAPPKRRYRTDPKMAHERAMVAARARNSPDTYIGQIERAELTDAHRRRLAAILMPWLADLDGATAPNGGGDD